MLKLSGVIAGYGEITIIKGIDLHVKEGRIAAIIGSNGAGKSTIMKTITGIVPNRGGKIIFRGDDISSIPAYDRVKLGISLVPEGREIFGRLTVEKNLAMGAYTVQSEKSFRESLGFAYRLFPRLEERKNQLARSLSGGEMQMLSIGRALMSNPSLLLLDEPSLGIAPVVVKQIFKVIGELNEQERVTVLIVEQNVKEALSLADYTYVLKNGEIEMEGPSDELAGSELIKKSFLGM
ncbi:MAG: ATP-binding cassette domain-containing protein [Deltaproteobacteria bacterium]|nr:ATP-binding cassette domain-containing protein [Deltaproteobacteria bacterium]NIS78623.1 ATP-binding cassette domain-containing protein [Deltaproteobacteria bacterium]